MKQRQRMNTIKNISVLLQYFYNLDSLLLPYETISTDPIQIHNRITEAFVEHVICPQWQSHSPLQADEDVFISDFSQTRCSSRQKLPKSQTKRSRMKYISCPWNVNSIKMIQNCFEKYRAACHPSMGNYYILSDSNAMIRPTSFHFITTNKDALTSSRGRLNISKTRQGWSASMHHQGYNCRRRP